MFPSPLSAGGRIRPLLRQRAHPSVVWRSGGVGEGPSGRQAHRGWGVIHGLLPPTCPPSGDILPHKGGGKIVRFDKI